MSVKIEMEIPTAQGNGRCKIEVPLEAIILPGKRGSSYEETQQRIASFASNTIIAVATATQISSSNDTTTKKTKPAQRQAGNNRQKQPPVVVFDPSTNVFTVGEGCFSDFVNITLLPVDKRQQDLNTLNVRIRRDLPLEKALDAFSTKTGMPSEVFRLFFRGRPLEMEDTAHTLNIQDGTVIYVCCKLSGWQA